jgi:N-acyl-L-homoserine lactone synthetase
MGAMLRYVWGYEIATWPKLQRSMHVDRADQFKRRLKWHVTVDDAGLERDEYDRDDTLYVIWVMPDGSHGGSMRFLPLDGPTMVNDHFQHLLGERPIYNPKIWECTRFCLSKGVPSHIAAALMLGGGELMRHFGLTHLLGVFDARVIRIYRMIGAQPKVLGFSGEGIDRISVGLWQYEHTDRIKVLRRAGVSTDVSEHWFLRSFGVPISAPKVA